MVQNITTCQVDECINPATKRGWCGSHYSRWRRWGDVRPDLPLIKPRQADLFCSVDRCCRPAWCLGLCRTHHHRQFVTGSVQEDVPIESPGASGRSKAAEQRQIEAEATPGGRRCFGACNHWLTWNEFSLSSSGLNGHAAVCKTCRQWRGVELRFGITKIEFTWLLQVQGGVCALCTTQNGSKRLAIAHDHNCCGPSRACKKCIRGLLCDSCNMILGKIETSAALMAKFDVALWEYLGQRPFVGAI